MKARDWLVQQRLAKPNARGRFSLEAKAALKDAFEKGIVFDDYTAQGKIVADKPKRKKRGTKAVVTAAAVMQAGFTRKETVCYGIDKATSSAQSNLVIAFQSCSGCGKPISRCTHDIPLLPAWIGGGTALLTKP